MFKTLKIFLLFALVSQVSMMPVSQAFAARHVQNDSHGHPMLSAQANLTGVEFQQPVKFNTPADLSDQAQFPSQPQYVQTQCSAKQDHNCGSCQSASVFGSLMSASVQLTPEFTPAEYHNVRLSYPLYSVVISPPLRPPTS